MEILRTRFEVEKMHAAVLDCHICYCSLQAIGFEYLQI